MASATAFLDKYVADTQDDEEDIVVPSKDVEEGTEVKTKTEEPVKEDTDTTTTTQTTKESPTEFLSKYVEKETPVAETRPKSELQAAIEAQPTKEIKAEEGSTVSGAQSLLGSLLSNIQQGVQQQQQEVVEELKQTAEMLPTDTEAYKTLEEQTKTYFGQSLQDLSATPSITNQAGIPAPGAQPTTKFLDQYIGDISKSIQTGAEASLSNLLGKPVTASASAPTILDQFKQNIGNAQAQAIAAAQQAGSSSLASTDKYSTAVNSTGAAEAYTPPITNVAITPAITEGKSDAQATSVVPVKSNPQPINYSQLSASSQKTLEDLTGVSAMKNSIQSSVSAPDWDLNAYNSTTSTKALTDEKTLNKVADTATAAFSSLPESERQKAAESFLGSFVNKTASFLNGFTGLGSSVQDWWSVGMNRLGEGLDQIPVVTGEPAQWFLNYLANTGKDRVTEADVSIGFLYGLDKLLKQPQNADKIKNLKPGEAVTVSFSGASGGDEYRVAMAMGESAVVYKDQNGNLRITDTKDRNGNSTIKDGKFTGNPGIYMFDKGEGGSYKVDAAGLPGASDILDAMEALGIKRKEFAIDIAVGAGPETIAKQVLNGLSQIIKYAIPALYTLASAKDAFGNALNEKAEGAKELLKKILDKMNLPYPFEDEEDLTKKEWVLRGMWSGGPYYKSTEEIEQMVSYLYGSAGVNSYHVQQALERYPWWKPDLSSGRVSSVPVPHRFANPQLRETIMGGGVLSDGPVWFESYLSRNPELLGIESTTEEQWNKEKVFKAAQNIVGQMFQNYLNAVNDGAKSVNWGDVMNQIANQRR